MWGASMAPARREAFERILEGRKLFSKWVGARGGMPALSCLNTPPSSAVVAYLTLGQMALNFLRQAISPSLQQKATWLDSAWTAAAINQLAASIKTLAAIHDEHLSASNPHKHLIVSGIAVCRGCGGDQSEQRRGAWNEQEEHW
jgi:hypothetical protein